MAVSLSLGGDKQRAGGPWAFVLAILGGVVWGLCFGRDAVTFAPWMALVPLFLVLGAGGRRAAWLAYAHGVAFWLTSMSWIAPTMETYGQLPSWLAVALCIALGLYLGSFSGIFGWLGASLWRRGGWMALAGLPALWVAVEWLRAHYLMNGFPWNLAAYAWSEMPGALPLAAWIGAYGVSFVLVFANVAIARSLVRRDWRTAVVSILGCLLLLAAAGRFRTVTPEPAPGQGLPVRLLQPNITNLVEWDEQLVRQNYSKVLRLVEECLRSSGRAGGLAGECGVAVLLRPECRAARGSGGAGGGWLPDPLQFDHGEGGVLLQLGAACSGPRGSPAGTTNVIWCRLVNMCRWAGGYHFSTSWRGMPEISAPVRELLLLPWREEWLGAAVCFEVVFPFEVADALCNRAPPSW